MAFIVFEGLDGSGKSTQMQRLADDIRSRGKNVVVTREPGGTPLAEELRQLVLRVGEEVPAPRCELLVYEAARAQHVEQVIGPALSRGEWVLSDRFAASSVAFQSGGREISRQEVDWLNDFATRSLQPDLYILIDVPVEESERRRVRRTDQSGVGEDRLESERREFHELVRQSYLQQAEEASHWLKIDGRLGVDEIFATIIKYLEQKKWLES